MPMSSYEVVRRAIEFEKPDRLPVRFVSLGISDVHSVGWNQIGTGDHAYRETLDEWGCTWVRSEAKNMGQVKGHPLRDWAALDRYRWPDADNPAFYAGMDAKFAGSEGKYVTTGIFMLLFERMHTLHGFENTLADLFVERERIEMLADRIVETDLAIMRNIHSRFPGRIHGFTFTDDWGSEIATFINPRQWEEFFKPRYKRIFDRIHKAGVYSVLHVCGNASPAVPDLIECGLDCLESLQPESMDVYKLKREYGRDIRLWGGLGCQSTLLSTPEAVRQEVRRLKRELGRGGGYILHGAKGIMADTPAPNVIAYLEEALNQDY